jgi:hypothetical protein
MAEVVVIVPIPRYITKKCCESKFSHGSDDFECEVAAGVEALKCRLKGWAQDSSLN